MLVICDFLLLSMLALARFDPPEEAPEATLDASATSESAEAELIELLEESLESELESRTNLNENLAETREALQEKALILAEREAALAQTTKDLEAKAIEAAELARTKTEAEAERKRIAEENTAGEARRAQLAERYEQTRTQLELANQERVELTENFGQLKAAASISQERLTQTAEELIAREIALAEKEAALKEAELEREKLSEERQQLTRKLEVAQAERSLLEQKLAEENLEKIALRKEKEAVFAQTERLSENVSDLGRGVTQLGTGVTQLGQEVSTIQKASEAIQTEIDASRPRTTSEIFTKFQNNRANIRFQTVEKTLFGGTTQRTYGGSSILISDPEGTYLVIHSASTPFAFAKNRNALLNVSLEIELNGRRFPVSQIGFLSTDPRLIFIPLPRQYVDGTNLETFQLAIQPDRWEEAILVKNDESNFGRTGFRRLTSSERFLKMERPALGELFSNFASSRGDLAFTQNSRFIGVLTDSTHAVVIENFLASAIINLGTNFDSNKTSETLDRLKDRIRKLPSEVQ